MSIEELLANPTNKNLAEAIKLIIGKGIKPVEVKPSEDILKKINELNQKIEKLAAIIAKLSARIDAIENWRNKLLSLTK